MVLRLATALPLWPRVRQLILKHEVIDAVKDALSRSPLHTSLVLHNLGLHSKVEQTELSWSIDRRYATSVRQCLTFGTGTPQKPTRPGIRVNCTLHHQCHQIDILLDVLLWLDDSLVPGGTDGPPLAAIPPNGHVNRWTPLDLAELLSGEISALYKGIFPAGRPSHWL